MDLLLDDLLDMHHCRYCGISLTREPWEPAVHDENCPAPAINDLRRRLGAVEEWIENERTRSARE